MTQIRQQTAEKVRLLASRPGAAGEAAGRIINLAEKHWQGDIESALQDAAEGRLGGSVAGLAAGILRIKEQAIAALPATPATDPLAEWVASLGFAVPAPDALWAVHRDEVLRLAQGMEPTEARRRSLLGIIDVVRSLADAAEYAAPRSMSGGMVICITGADETGMRHSVAAPRWVPASAADMRGETDYRPIPTAEGEAAAKAARAAVIAEWAGALAVCRPVRDAAQAAQAAAPRLTRAQRRAARG
jgi:hypothetical protein